MLVNSAVTHVILVALKTILSIRIKWLFLPGKPAFVHGTIIQND